jgi:hypothetical protein
MAENDKKGFSGLGELAPKKKNRVKVETESAEPQIQTPKQAEKNLLENQLKLKEQNIHTLRIIRISLACQNYQKMSGLGFSLSFLFSGF